jgi:NAD-dependent deacetylase
MSDALARIAARLSRCERILFITGAGMSAESGLPTYRGIGGLYEELETDEGVPIEDALSGEMMRRRPEVCWKYILQIERACRGARPNRGHQAIAALEERFDVSVLTQNVDGLHHAAGSRDIIDIHGDIRALLCTRCDHRRRASDFEGLACPPRCPDCGAVVRPDVVLFGEALPLPKVARMQAALGADAVFSVGTTSVFPYIAEPVLEAAERGALTVEINPGETLVSGLVEEKLALSAGEALAAIVQRLKS